MRFRSSCRTDSGCTQSASQRGADTRLYQEWRECENKGKNNGAGECKLKAKTAVPLDALPAEFLSLQQPALFDFARSKDLMISGSMYQEW